MSLNFKYAAFLGAAIFCTATVIFSSTAWGYKYIESVPIRWPGNKTTMYISTISMPPGSTWDQRLREAMGEWNNVAGSGFVFHAGRDTDGRYRGGNSVNEIYFTSNLGYPLAYAYWWYRYDFAAGTIELSEADIAFNTNYRWTTSYAFDYSSHNLDNKSKLHAFQGVALHELGHVLGLGHDNSKMSNMNGYYPNGGPFASEWWQPYGDDCMGIRSLYPNNTQTVDIALSAHRPNSAVPGASEPTNAFPYSRVAPGSKVTISYSFSNRGTSDERFNIGFYLSTNQYISTSDRYLGRNIGAWAAPGATGTWDRTLRIPNGTSPGYYYIGVIADYDYQLNDSARYNNQQYIPTLIRVQ